MRILLVDDDGEVRRIAALALSWTAEIKVIEADSGAAGIASAIRERPDVILLDLVMAGLDGLATLRLLKANDATALIPVIMLTARTASRDVEQLHLMGASGAIAKPFDPMRLAAEVYRAVQAARPSTVFVQA